MSTVITVSVSLVFILVAIIIRYTFVQKPLEKPHASWISFILAIIGTTICTLIAGEPQGTVITGFVTMLLSYNILCR